MGTRWEGIHGENALGKKGADVKQKLKRYDKRQDDLLARKVAREATHKYYFNREDEGQEDPYTGYGPDYNDFNSTVRTIDKALQDKSEKKGILRKILETIASKSKPVELKIEKEEINTVPDSSTESSTVVASSAPSDSSYSELTSDYNKLQDYLAQHGYSDEK